jgi:carboxyl-terminal processing protease
MLIVIPLLFLTLIIGLGGGVALDHFVIGPALEPKAIAPEEHPNYDLIQEAYEMIDGHYVDRDAIEQERLTYGAISGMVNALGDTGHSAFLSPSAVRSQNIDIQGEFEGIGAQVEMRNGYLTIVAPFDDSPAQKAGLKPGDMIVKVDDDDMTGKTLDEVISRVLGPAGSEVKLTIMDPLTGELRDVNIVRAKIILHNVTWAMVPDTTIAHIRLQSFGGGLTRDLKDALEQAKAAGATGIILDLRNNPGGLLDEAIEGTSQFIDSGNVLLTEDAQGERTEYEVRPGGLATDIPLVVLINGGTASAAEIASGAIQDAGRGEVIGEQTFGTGTVLNQFPLSDGSAVLLAVEQWLTPAGRVIWHEGITPDIEVKLPSSVNPLIPGQVKTMTLDDLQNGDDQQFAKALDVLLEKLK